MSLSCSGTLATAATDSKVPINVLSPLTIESILPIIGPLNKQVALPEQKSEVKSLLLTQKDFLALLEPFFISGEDGNGRLKLKMETIVNGDETFNIVSGEFKNGLGMTLAVKSLPSWFMDFKLESCFHRICDLAGEYLPNLISFTYDPNKTHSNKINLDAFFGELENMWIDPEALLKEAKHLLHHKLVDPSTLISTTVFNIE